jgi:GNAT superfamily N-acetyltransferase
MQVNIREAAKEDLQDIVELYKQPDMDDGKVLSHEQAQIIFDRINSYPNYKVYVAVLESTIVGTFALAIMDNLAHLGTPSGLIEDVVVKTTFQGRGIGKQMMEYAMEYCKRQGCYKVSLSSNLKREGAHRFYESLGYKKHGYSFLLELGDGKQGTYNVLWDM